MAGLVISLKPNEKFLVNGALLTNGPRRSQICVGDDVNVLRMSDALHPDDVNTPIRRIYYDAQLILSGDVPQDAVAEKIQKSLTDLQIVFNDTPLQSAIEKAKQASEVGRYYSVMCRLKPLLEVEQQMLNGKPAEAEPARMRA